MRTTLLLLALLGTLGLLGCGGKSDPNDDDGNGNASSSKLARPGALPRPPTDGLPDDLRPPR